MPRKANPNRPEYAQIIASAREEKQISQELFGHLIGRDAASVKKYEGGKVVPPFFVLMRIAKELSLDKELLVTLILQTENSTKWLDSALSEADLIFSNSDIGIASLHDPERIQLQLDGKEATCDKLEFLFKIADILQSAKERYNQMVVSEADSFAKSLINS